MYKMLFPFLLTQSTNSLSDNRRVTDNNNGSVTVFNCIYYDLLGLKSLNLLINEGGGGSDFKVLVILILLMFWYITSLI